MSMEAGIIAKMQPLSRVKASTFALIIPSTGNAVTMRLGWSMTRILWSARDMLCPAPGLNCIVERDTKELSIYYQGRK